MTHADRKPPTPAARRLCEALRLHAHTYPEAHEDHPWGEIALKVRGKTFVFLGADGDSVGFSVKLPQSADQALALPFAQPTGYGLGKSGWVSVTVGSKTKAPAALLESWIEESWCAVAPKALVKARAAGGAAPAVGKARRKAPRKAAGRKRG